MSGEGQEIELIRTQHWIIFYPFFFPACNSNVDLYFVVDSSESIIQDDPHGKPLFHWGQVKDYLGAVVANLPVSEQEIRVGMVKYSDTVHHEFGLQNYYKASEIGTHFQDMQHTGGNTNTARALESVLTFLLDPGYGGRDNARKVIVLLTDGLSNKNQDQTILKALELKNHGVEIFVVSMETDVDEQELMSVASDPTEKYVIVQSFLNGPTHLIDFTVFGICDLPIPTPPPPSEYTHFRFSGILCGRGWLICLISLICINTGNWTMCWTIETMQRINVQPSDEDILGDSPQ